MTSQRGPNFELTGNPAVHIPKGFLYSFLRPAPFDPPARYSRAGTARVVHTHLYSFFEGARRRPASIVRTLHSIVRTLRLSRNTIGRPELRSRDIWQESCVLQCCLNVILKIQWEFFQIHSNLRWLLFCASPLQPRTFGTSTSCLWDVHESVTVRVPTSGSLWRGVWARSQVSLILSRSGKMGSFEHALPENKRVRDNVNGLSVSLLRVHG